MHMKNEVQLRSIAYRMILDVNQKGTVRPKALATALALAFEFPLLETRKGGEIN